MCSKSASSRVRLSAMGARMAAPDESVNLRAQRTGATLPFGTGQPRPLAVRSAPVSAEGSLRNRRLLMGLAALAMLPLLGGCIAAAALVPVAAAAGMIGTNVRVRA